MMTTEQESVMLTVEELAKRWKVDHRTVRTMIEEGKIKVLRVGRLIRISRSHVEFLEQNGI